GWPDADETRPEQTLQLVVVAADLFEGELEHGDRLVSSMEVVELAPEQEADLRSPPRLVDQLICLPQVLRGRRAVDERLGGAELEQNIDSRVVGGWLGERATEICDRVLPRPAGAGTERGLAKALDDGGVRGRRNEQQMGGDPFRFRLGCNDQPS